MSARVAVYYAPARADPLWPAACAWLGRDPETAAAVPQPDIQGLHEITADARLYGLHCTLKPPMRLRTDYAAFVTDVDRLAAEIAPFHMPALAVQALGPFLAIRETEPAPALQRLADLCVERLDAHRAPPTEAELARRRAAGMSPAREANLVRWGYPQVFAEWRFHMTLTRRLDAQEHARILPLAEAHLAAALPHPRACTDLCVFTQAGPGQPFLVAERLPLRG